MGPRSTILPLVFALYALIASGYSVAIAQDIKSTNRSAFNLYCASCHGRDATGGGPAAPFLRTTPPDLTGLQRANGGVYPADEIAATIDGRNPRAGHMIREMPIWGSRFMIESTGANLLPAGRSTKDRITGLVDYIRTLQK